MSLVQENDTLVRNRNALARTCRQRQTQEVILFASPLLCRPAGTGDSRQLGLRLCLRLFRQQREAELEEGRELIGGSL